MGLSGQRSATDSANFVKVEKRNNARDTIAGKVREDDLTNPEKRGGFAPSVSQNILDKNPGWSGGTRPTEELHQTEKGLKTLSSDSRKGRAPLPEDGVKLNIHGRRRDEHVIGRSANDINDDNTVAGQDLAPNQEGFGKRNRDTIKGKGRRDI